MFDMAVRPSLLHRVYIQSLLSRRAMREDLALEMYKRAVGVCQSISSSLITLPRV